MRFHFSSRSVASRYAGRLINHLVDLHEMVTAGMPLNHFSRMGKMVSLSADSPRAVQRSVPEPRSTCVASTVGASLVKPALGQTVPQSMRAQALRRVAQGEAWEQKGGEG
jgi:hypothetical protein